MATATITWIPVNGSNYEIWYAKLSVVGSTSLPPSAGWIQATGSPFDSSLGIATITGLDNNTQYRFASRNDCISIDSAWQTNLKYKLVCPTFSLVANPVSPSDTGASITATVNLLNLVEFESIASTITLTFKKTSDSSVADTKVFTSPYTSSILTYTSSSLLVTTGYIVYLSIHDGIANTDIACSNQSISTLTPVVVPPPVCPPSTFSIIDITTTTITVILGSPIAEGDLWDVSVDGGVTYIHTGDPSVGGIITVGGLISGTSYQVVVRRNCISGGQGISPSQTITTLVPSVIGTVSMIKTHPYNGEQDTGILAFTFPQPLVNAITLYIGYTWENTCSSCANNVCLWSNGSDIFPTAPQTCTGSGAPLGAGGDTYSGPAHLPFVVNIPAGSTSYTATNIFTTIGGTGQHSGGFVVGPWLFINPNPGGGSARGYTDLYIKVNSPSGYTSSFSYVDSTVIKGVTIHNV